MTPKKALFFSNTVMLLAIMIANGFLFYFWPSWHNNEASQADDYFFYMIWVALPFGLMFITNFFITGSVNALLFIAFSALFFLGITSINYFYYMAVLSDGRSGLIFTVLPFLQLFGSLVTIIVATIIKSAKRQE